MKNSLFFLCLCLSGSSVLCAQTVIRLYDAKVSGVENRTGNSAVKPDSLPQGSVSYTVAAPTLTAFLPTTAGADGTAVILFPGEEERADMVEWFIRKGIAAFVVNHQVGQGMLPAGTGQTPNLSSRDSVNALAIAIAAGKKAITYLRQHTAELGIKPDRIGVLGFSAGSAIALRLAYDSVAANRPSFVGLVYPNAGTLVTGPVPADAPFLFIVAANASLTDASRLAAIQSTRLYQHWLIAGQSAELHSYAPDGPKTGIPQRELSTEVWLAQLTNWLNRQGYLRNQSVSQPVPGSVAVTTGQPAAALAAVPPKPAVPAEAAPGIPEPVSVSKPKAEVIIRNRPLAVAGQSSLPQVSGTVRDSATGQPLAGAAIVIDYRKRITGTTTNAQGYFAVELPIGQHILVARLIGYTPVRKELRITNEPIMLDVAMISVASQLEEVVVTTKGLDQTVRQPMLGVSQLNVNALKKLPSALGEVDLLRGLQMLPGVTSVGEASNGVNIRGGTTDQNLILLDDTPIFNPTHMFGLFSVFPPDVLSTVDLYKGNVPARFGGRAASVLDVALRTPNLDKFSLSGGVSVVSNKLTIDIPIVKGKFGILVAGRGAFNDFLLPIVSDRLANIRARFGDGVVKAFWRVNDHNTLTVTGYASKDLFRTDLLANLPNVNGTATRYDHQTVNVMARWFRTLSPRLNLQTTGVYAQYVPRILSPELTGNVVTLRSSVLQRQVKSNLNYQLENQKLEVGVSGTHYRLEPGTLLPGQSESVQYVTTPTENALELALHTDYERSVGPRLAISAGLRYSEFLSLGPSLVRHYAAGETRDNVSVMDSTRYGAGQITQSYGGFEPRLGLRYTLGPNASLKLGYNLMRQYLQVVTNTTTPLPTSRWKTSDPNIKPQVSQLLTVGYFLSFKKNIYEFTAESYWRATRHIIDYRPGADFLLQPYPETQLLQGESRAYGIETMISKKKGELTGWLNYTYARTLNQVYEGPTVEENVNGGAWYRANYDRPHTVNANITIDVDRHNSFGFTFAYSTGRPYSSPTGFVTIDGAQYPYYGVRNNQRLPAYHRMDFTWNIYNPSMRNRRWEGRWALTLYNLYGRKNAYSVFFKAEDGKTNAYQLQIFAAVIPSLSYNFVFR